MDRMSRSKRWLVAAAVALALAAGANHVRERLRWNGECGACWYAQLNLTCGLGNIETSTGVKYKTLPMSADLLAAIELAYLSYEPVDKARCPISRGDGGWKYFRTVEEGLGLTCLVHGHKEKPGRRDARPSRVEAPPRATLPAPVLAEMDRTFKHGASRASWEARAAALQAAAAALVP
jgi:hypothetical protein